MPLRVLIQPFVTQAPDATQGLAVAITVWNDSPQFALLYEMSCSWMDAYRIDGSGVRIQMARCKSNFMTVRRLMPDEKMVHGRTSLTLYGPLPGKLTFRVALVQPEHKLTQEDVLHRAQTRGDNVYSLGNALRRELYTGKEITVWSEPVTVRAKTRWFDGLQ